MDISRFGTKDAEEVGDMERVTGWLETLTIEESEAEIHCDAAYADNGNGQPVTPPRRLMLQEWYEGISPTDTSFSGGSVFDIMGQGYYEPGSPCRKGRGRDDVSEATSCEEDEDKQFFAILERKKAEVRIGQPNFTSRRLQSASLTSYDPPSDNDDDDDDDEPEQTATQTTPPVLNPSTPPPNIPPLLPAMHPRIPPLLPHPTCLHTLRPQRQRIDMSPATPALPRRDLCILHVASALETQGRGWRDVKEEDGG